MLIEDQKRVMNLNRRNFLRNSGLVGGAIVGLPSILLGQATAGSSEQASSRKPIPVILATDIGDDIDDT
jgi:hypothetical protein